MSRVLFGARLCGLLTVLLVAGCLFSRNNRGSNTPNRVNVPAQQMRCPRTALTPGMHKQFPFAARALAILKHTLEQDRMWRSGRGATPRRYRHEIASILEDPGLRFEFSPPLVPRVHLQGKSVVAAQTVNAKLIRFSAFAGKDAYQLARTMLHELMHVHQIRFQRQGYILNLQPLWELPAYHIEAQLPPAFFRAPPPMPCLRPALAPPRPPAGACRHRRNRWPVGQGKWVAWTTPPGWLHVGTTWELQTQQQAADELWAGNSGLLVKTRVNKGPWQSREHAIEDLSQYLRQVSRKYHPTNRPRETVEGNLFGRHIRMHLSTNDRFSFKFGAEIAIMKGEGITPRVVFPSPRTLLHVNTMSSTDGPKPIDRWLLTGYQPKNGTLVLPEPDGSTRSYKVDRSHGPFADSFAIVPTLRNQRISSVTDPGTKQIVTPANMLIPPRDYGMPFCR